MRFYNASLRKFIIFRKPNEPHYQEHTFLQESSWVTDLETSFMWTQTSQLITLCRKNIDNRLRQSFYYPKVTKILCLQRCVACEVHVNLNFSTKVHFTLFHWFKSRMWQNRSNCASAKSTWKPFNQQWKVTVIILRCRMDIRLSRKSGYFKRWLEYSS